MRTHNIQDIFIDKDDTWLVNLSAAEFSVISATNGLKDYSPGKSVFGRDMIIPIKHTVDWELIHHQN